MQRMCEDTQRQRLQEALPTSSGAVVPAEANGPEAHWGKIRDLIREELSSSISAPSQVAPQPAQPMQFIINNSTQNNVAQHVTQAAPPPPELPPEDPHEPETFVEGVLTFLRSPLNRLCIYSVLGIGLYMLQGHLSHKWRMAELKRRIDANLFLRFQHMVLQGGRTG
eukprot:TRINITY_DN71658_c0_g1_i1.p1 TRINITY_DN71658_c0_g1~~TRINITY_DN71658_c0_g1_i1.p1  ORF type:complete len:194 (-),score=25.36 TRINITY_DN71658_c0_g1_i1:51-551(-)